jgi:ribosomal-protein-alanine N-acetyltransferase
MSGWEDPSIIREGGGWRLTRGGERDGGVLASIHTAAFADAWDADTLTAFLIQPGGFALIADNEVAGAGGFLLARVLAGESEVLTLAVRPDCRRTGCATALIEGALALAAALGARRMVLEVGADNAAAQALYARAGFESIGRRPRYYRSAAGLPVDALLLAADC